MTEEIYELYTKFMMHQCGDAWVDRILALKWELTTGEAQ